MESSQYLRNPQPVPGLVLGAQLLSPLYGCTNGEPRPREAKQLAPGYTAGVVGPEYKPRRFGPESKWMFCHSALLPLGHQIGLV